MSNLNTIQTSKSPMQQPQRSTFGDSIYAESDNNNSQRITHGNNNNNSTYQRDNTFSRNDTSESNLLFRRTVSNVGLVFGHTLDNEAWTDMVIETLERAEDHQPNGNFAIPPAFANKRDFWVCFFLTAISGVLLGFLALCYLNFVDFIPKQWTDDFPATKTSDRFTCDSACSQNIDDIVLQQLDPDQYDDPCACNKYKNYGFYKGKLYWIAVPVIAGFIISLIRYFSGYPDKVPGIYEELNTCHVNYKLAPYTFIISAISLAGGAALGPEAGMANFGGGLMCFLDQYIILEDPEYRKLFILGGFAAVFGALFPTPILAVIIVFELCEPPKTYMAGVLILFAGAIPAWLVFWAVER